MTALIEASQRQRLRELADASIRHGLNQGTPLPVDLHDWPPPLREHGASFVTLELDGNLRGCIGSIEPRRALVEDIAQNAFAAAFRDPRFPPCRPDEVDRLQLSLSVLGPLSPLTFSSQDELFRLLRPQVDGLVLQAGARRAVFLPQVWEQLPQPRDFVHHLLLKAGLETDTQPPSLQAWHYEVEHF